MNQTAGRPALRAGSLRFIEVLATSIALIGPSMTPLLIAPYMYADAGNGTWLAYVFGGTMLVFVALCINQFARRSTEAGSMYGYVADHLGPALGAVGGWALLWAYGFVATAVLGAMALFIERLASGHLPVTLVVVVLAVVAWQLAYRGVQISAIAMLVLEAISVSIILLLVAIVLRVHGVAPDAQQVRVRGGFPGGIGLAIATAVFSFVGFESATAFGAEAKQPLVNIPRAVMGSVLFATAFFVVATYAEILGLQHASQPLDKQQFPLQALVDIYGLGYLAVPITVGAVFSAFSVCLACITTGGRIAYAMAAAKLLPPIFARIEPKHDTPNVAVTVVTATALAVALAALGSGVATIDVFNNCGTLSSFGFILIYMLVAIAAMAYVKQLGELRSIDLIVSGIALALLILSTVWFFGTISGPQHWFVYYFTAFIVAGAIAFYFSRRRKASG
jgi:amino acid transporter